jgi:hypothetical protein
MDADDDDGAEEAARRELVTLTWTSSTTMALQKLRDKN